MLKTKPILGALIEKINAAHPMTKLDVGEYAEIKAPMMKFEISAYKAEGLGHVSVMSMSGMLGLMKMDTIIINPKDRDLPLLSYDRVYAAGNDTFIVELYDTMATPIEMTALGKVKSDAAALPANDLGEHWYDSIKLPESLSFKGKKNHEAEFDRVALAAMDAYLAAEDNGELDASVKAEKSDLYVEGLLKNGGPSTSLFLKLFGLEKTTDLFRTVLFGTER